MKFITSTVTSPGGRENNEDYAAEWNHNNCFCCAVTDGLGGHRSGEVASKIAAESFCSAMKHAEQIDINTIADGVLNAQKRIIEEENREQSNKGMRTTMAALVSDRKKIYYTYAGDTRIYRFKGGKITFQSSDHSVPQSLADSGIITQEQIRFHEDRNRLLRVLGCPDHYRPAFGEFEPPFDPEDRFLLCTDGFWEPVDEIMMCSTLKTSKSPEEWLSKMEELLLDRLKEGSDNYTATAVFVK